MDTKARIGIAVLAVAGMWTLAASRVGAQHPPIGASAANGWNSTGAVSLVDYSGERDTAGDPSGANTRKVINTINGSGISADGTTHVAANPFGVMAMFAQAPGASGTFGVVNDFGTPNPGTDQAGRPHWVTYAFDQIYRLDKIDIWNYNENPTWFIQGWKHLKVQVSETNGTAPSAWSTVYDDLLPQAPGGGDLPASLSIPLANVRAQFVTLINTGGTGEANWCSGTCDDSHSGLSEVRFYGAPTQVAGDVDGNGTVGIEDYNIIRQRMFTPVTLRSEGDLVRNNFVDFADFKEWKSHAPASVLASLNIPEPWGLTLAGIVALGMGGRRRLRRD